MDLMCAVDFEVWNDYRSLNETWSSTATRTGLPSFVPGLNRHCLTASIAFLSKSE